MIPDMITTSLVMHLLKFTLFDKKWLVQTNCCPINFGRTFASSQNTSTPLKSVSPVILAHRLTLKPHFTCFKKGKVHSHSDTAALSETTLELFQIRESVKQPTNSANKIYSGAGGSMAGLWMGKGEGVWLDCGLGASNPRPGTKAAPGWD